MKIAIASSGIGHIARGMEVWASCLAEELYARGFGVTLFKGAGPVIKPYDIVLPTFKRNRFFTKILAFLTSKGGWRIGLGAPHSVESFFYGIQLLFHLQKGYDLVHFQQGSLGNFLYRAQRLNLLKIPYIFANGQKANSNFLSKFPFVQLLNPFDTIGNKYGGKTRQFFIPNFVDTKRFSPGDKKISRRKMGLPDDSLLILSVGLIDKSVKRMDYFIKEAYDFILGSDKRVKFVIAGSESKESAEIQKIGKELLGDNLIFFKNIKFEFMADLYKASDVFVLCSYREAFGLSLVEAMACGVPVICHNFPIMQWVVGSGGTCIDLSKRGALKSMMLKFYMNSSLRTKKGLIGRKRVEEQFSCDIVIDRIVEMYSTVLSENSLNRSK